MMRTLPIFRRSKAGGEWAVEYSPKGAPIRLLLRALDVRRGRRKGEVVSLALLSVRRGKAGGL